MTAVCLLSCKKPLSFFETPHGSTINPFKDDEVLVAAFAARGVRAERIAWDAKGIDWKSFDCAIVRSTWDYFTRCDEFLQFIDGLEIPVWNSPATIRWNSNKKYLLDFAKRGAPVVPTVLIPEITSEIPFQIAKERGWDQFVVKPTVGGGALATYRFPDDYDRRHELESAYTKEFIIQPFVKSVPVEGEWSFVFFKGKFQYAALKTPKKGDYRVQSIHGASQKFAKPSEVDLKAAREILALAEEETLYARVDMVREDTGKLALMELELIEPYLYFNETKEGATNFVKAVF